MNPGNWNMRHFLQGRSLTEAALLACFFIGGVSACSFPTRSGAQAGAPDVTHAYATVEARLTLAVAMTPTPPSPTPQPTRPPEEGSPTSSPPAEPSPSLTSTQPPAAAALCDKASPGSPVDVTIEDNTVMAPGQKFTKIWKLVNSGTCTWNRHYQAVWFFGAKLGDSLGVPISGDIAPNQSVEVAVDMAAPDAPGTYQSNWKLSNGSGKLFGIGPNGDLPFWVKIIVQSNAATQTSTATGSPTGASSAVPTSPAAATSTAPLPPTQTPTPTATQPAIATLQPTTPVHASVSVVLAVDQKLDLDTGQVNPPNGEDLLYQKDSKGVHWLVPQNGALLGVYGANQPGSPICKSATMSTAPIAVESLPPGTYLCDKTDQGRPGWLRLSSLNPADGTIGLTLLTWSVP